MRELGTPGSPDGRTVLLGLVGWILFCVGAFAFLVSMIAVPITFLQWLTWLGTGINRGIWVLDDHAVDNAIVVAILLPPAVAWSVWFARQIRDI